MTGRASALTPPVYDGYALVMSPRTARDQAAISVDIESGSIGSGKPEQGGGHLAGGLTLLNRFRAHIEDPAVPYLVVLTVVARAGWLACESVTITEKPGGPAVTAMALRSMTLSLYIQRVREELGEYAGGALITKESGRTENTISFEPPSDADWDALDFAQRRRSAQLTTELVAACYREALASPDPEQNRRPTAAVADRLNASRGHISRLLTQARREGLPGLGPTRAPRTNQVSAGEQVKRDEQPIVAAIVTSDRGVLVGRRNDGRPLWTFIAGEQDAVQDENPADTAIRETKEETGLRIVAGDEIGRRVHPVTNRLMVYVAAKPALRASLDVVAEDTDELAEVKWISLAEADGLLPGMFEPVREHLERELGGTA
jgi:8-oxo-dGTP pyrophosphatase MutT (NUDIX family)